MGPKKIPANVMCGQSGVSLVERIVQDQIGFVWRPTPLFDSGIDGTIEIRDPETGAVSNSLVQVHIKATSKPFQAETATGFDYLCEADDLAYWLQGNMPVILVVCRPDTEEAYWVSVKDYFRDPDTRKSRKVRFDKERDRLGVECRRRLIALAVPPDAGFYLAPPRKVELLYTNLLPVSQYHPSLLVAETTYRKRNDLWAALHASEGKTGGEWVLRDGRVYTVHDLREAPWPRVIDRGTVEEFAMNEWALSDDADAQRTFVQLLNCCLRGRLWRQQVRYDNERDCYQFPAEPQSARPEGKLSLPYPAKRTHRRQSV